MALADNLLKIIAEQKQALAGLEEEVRQITQDDCFKENERLKSELQAIKDDLKNAKDTLHTLKDETASLKNALYEQIYNERLKILNATSKKMDIYFQSEYEGEQNRLSQLEQSVKRRIDEMTEVLKENRVEAEDEIFDRLKALSLLLDQKVTMARAKYEKEVGAFTENDKLVLEELKEQKITEETIKQVAKKNNWESFIGLNLINKLGIFFIIIGVITVSQLTYMQMQDIYKGILMFALGGVMLLVGEIMNRKNPSIFSLGITSGGVAVLYVALSVSYFGLTILHMYPAIALCILITAGAFVLSVRYNSQTIAAFALIGGYLPLFTVSDTGSFLMIYGTMIYLVALNLLALLLSFRKKWIIATYIGFFLNVFGLILIIVKMNGLIIHMPFGIHHLLTIVYVILAFVNYTLIPILGNITEKLRFKKADVALLGLNTFISSLVLYSTFYTFDLQDFNGLLAVLFALIYLGIGKGIERSIAGEKQVKALFYLTGLAFVVLIIPFQFGKMWLSLGWLAEGVLLTTYGILTKDKNFKRYGFIINGLCLFSFLFIDLWTGHLFAYKYFAITLGSLIILSAYIYQKTLYGSFSRLYKYATIVNLWFYSIYFIFNVLAPKVSSAIKGSGLDVYYLMAGLFIAITFLIAYAVPRIKILSDKGVKVISIILYAIGIFWTYVINTIIYPTAKPILQMPMPILLLGTMFLLIIGLLSVLALYDLLKLFVLERRLGIEWLPLLLSFYFVLLLTQNLISQYQLAFINASISIIYVLAALFWIIFGFMKRYTLMRRFGLGLSFLAIAKLFILDLSELTKGYQIISYFAFGLALIAISLVYQKFNKKLELRGAVVSDAEEGM